MPKLSWKGRLKVNNYRERYQYWLDSPALSEDEWKELSAIADDDEEIKSRFFAPLEFGTAGLRGEMAVGLRRMNAHIIRWATQAFANVIKAEGEAACRKGVVICFDCRTNSENFAREAAAVMAANGVHVRIFDALRPTPELSFAVIHYGATAGLNVTASHNPKEYNGYKVYWADGAQLPPQHAAAIASGMEKTDVFRDIVTMSFDDAVAQGLVEFIGAETDEAFLAKVMGQVMMLKNANSKTVIADVKKRVAEVQKSLPEGIFINPVIERGELIAKTTVTVVENIVIGCIIVTIVVFLLLGNIRSSLVIASMIPLTLFFTLSLMYVFKVDANLMSLGALDFGIIIDGAVIIIEYIAARITVNRHGLLKAENVDRQT
ncbi:MAG: hypothetical protein EOM14_10430, partial [Clostridia bacterium]|nr:hypothetical protein [Clostridia bacterium]